MSRLSVKLLELKSIAEQVVSTDIAPLAETVDRDCLWPEHSLKALAQANLLGLQAPEALGGHGQGLMAMVLLTEAIGRACPSSALCYGMHCVGTAVITAKSTHYQREHYLREIAAGRHITTLALSETGSGAHLYFPGMQAVPEGDDLRVSGTKQFVTNGSHADSYVISVVGQKEDGQEGDFSCLILDAATPEIEWLEPWAGFGMRGNSSRGMTLDNVLVPRRNLLGEEGDQVWYAFEVVAPYFLMAMAGTYLGIAESALNEAGDHLRSRRYNHSQESLRHVPALQDKYAEMWIAVEKTRNLMYEAALRGDSGDPEALPFLLASKIDAVNTAVQITNEAMTICGGMAFRENSRVSQMLRDARAGHVMAPTTDMLRSWTGRALLGLPLL